MGAKQNDSSNITYLKLKAKTSDSDPTPFIGKNEKINGEWVIKEKFNSVDGNLTEIGSETYDYEGETKHKCKMKFIDPDGSISILESNFNNMLYNVLNSLAGTKKKGKIQIDVWLGKEKEGKRYASVAVKNNGEKTEWLYDWQNVPKAEKVKVGTKVVSDDSNVVSFWAKVITDINTHIKENAPMVTSEPASTYGLPESDIQPNENSDLPF
jgi:hypothetical protein